MLERLPCSSAIKLTACREVKYFLALHLTQLKSINNEINCGSKTEQRREQICKTEPNFGNTQVLLWFAIGNVYHPIERNSHIFPKFKNLATWSRQLQHTSSVSRKTKSFFMNQYFTSDDSKVKS